MSPHELAHQVVAQSRVQRWRLEVQQKSGRWTLAGFLPALAPDETPGHACWRLRQRCPIYDQRVIRAVAA